jgi:hypothetical protein
LRPLDQPAKICIETTALNTSATRQPSANHPPAIRQRPDFEPSAGESGLRQARTGIEAMDFDRLPVMRNTVKSRSVAQFPRIQTNLGGPSAIGGSGGARPSCS